MVLRTDPIGELLPLDKEPVGESAYEPGGSGDVVHVGGGFDPGFDIYVGIGIPIESEFQFIRRT